MFVVPLRPADAAYLAALGKATPSKPARATTSSAARPRRMWRGRPSPINA